MNYGTLVFDNRLLTDTPNDLTTIFCYATSTGTPDPTTSSGLFEYRITFSIYDWPPGGFLYIMMGPGGPTDGIRIDPENGIIIYRNDSTLFESQITNDVFKIIRTRIYSLKINKTKVSDDWHVYIDDFLIGVFPNTANVRITPLYQYGGSLETPYCTAIIIYELYLWSPSKNYLYHYDGLNNAGWFSGSGRAVATVNNQYLDASGTFNVGTSQPFRLINNDDKQGSYVIAFNRMPVSTGMDENVGVDLYFYDAVEIDPELYSYSVEIKLKTPVLTNNGYTQYRTLISSMGEQLSCSYVVDVNGSLYVVTNGSDYSLIATNFLVASPNWQKVKILWNVSTKVLTFINNAGTTTTRSVYTDPYFAPIINPLSSFKFDGIGGLRVWSGPAFAMEVAYVKVVINDATNTTQVFDVSSINPPFDYGKRFITETNQVIQNQNGTGTPLAEEIKTSIFYTSNGSKCGIRYLPSYLNHPAKIDWITNNAVSWKWYPEPTLIDYVNPTSKIPDIIVPAGGYARVYFSTFASWFDTPDNVPGLALTYKAVTNAIVQMGVDYIDFFHPGGEPAPEPVRIVANVAGAASESLVFDIAESAASDGFFVQYVSNPIRFEPTFFDSTAFETDVVAPTLIYTDSFESSAFEWTAFNMTYNPNQAEKIRRLKYWNGTAWVAAPLKMWNGAAWVEVVLRAVTTGTTFTKVSG